MSLVTGSAKPRTTDDATAHRARTAWDTNPDLRAEFGDKFETYLAYVRAEEKGAIRVIGKNMKVTT